MVSRDLNTDQHTARVNAQAKVKSTSLTFFVISQFQRLAQLDSQSGLPISSTLTSSSDMIKLMMGKKWLETNMRTETINRRIGPTVPSMLKPWKIEKENYVGKVEMSPL